MPTQRVGLTGCCAGAGLDVIVEKRRVDEALLDSTGGTGDLGGRIAVRLRERGVSVRALVRPADDTSALESLGIRLVRGDLGDAPSLGPALDGIDTVVTTANAISRLLGGDRTAPCLPPARGAGPPGQVQTGVALPRHRTELRRGARHHLRPGTVPERYVCEDDVAELTAQLAVEPDPPRLVEFGGPEAMTRLEVVAAMERPPAGTSVASTCPAPRWHSALGSHAGASPRSPR